MDILGQCIYFLKLKGSCDKVSYHLYKNKIIIKTKKYVQYIIDDVRCMLYLQYQQQHEL
jgi:hypothetical protein